MIKNIRILKSNKKRKSKQKKIKNMMNKNQFWPTSNKNKN